MVRGTTIVLPVETEPSDLQKCLYKYTIIDMIHSFLNMALKEAGNGHLPRITLKNNVHVY